jgi:UDP-4-amino-4,6-dideoxy-N-acetyl-beta-L-altrosamine transaminase
MIPYSCQDISEDDIRAVTEILRSDWLTQGPSNVLFERAVSERVGAAHGVATSSATAALHVACLALGLKSGGRLWTTPNTFVASANCGRYCGATVGFVDVDPRTYNLDPARLAEQLEAAERSGTLPDVVVAVDFAGQPCDWDALAALKARYGFALIDDASHALGATWRGQPVGAMPGADVTVFSFHPVKMITTGEGGMALTQDVAVADTLRLLRNHGITRDPWRMKGDNHEPWYYEQQLLGFHYRMTDLQAALGLSQLSRLDAFLAARRSRAARYDQLLAGLPLDRPWQHPDSDASRHLYPVRLHDADRRRAVFEHLRGAGIGVQVHYIPVHLQPDFRQFGFDAGSFPSAEAYYAGALSLPVHTRLTDAEQDRVVEVLAEALQ